MNSCGLEQHAEIRRVIETRFLISAPDGAALFPTAQLQAPLTAGIPSWLHALTQGQPEQAIPYLISRWSQWYFALLVAPWVYVHLRHQWQLPYHLADIAYVQSEQGTPQRFVLSSLGSPVEEREWQAFLPLIDEHIAPVCQQLSVLSGLSAALFWNNAGVRFYQGMNQAEQEGADVRHAADLLDRPVLANGEKSLYQPIRLRTLPSGEQKKRAASLLSDLSSGRRCALPELPASARRTPQRHNICKGLTTFCCCTNHNNAIRITEILFLFFHTLISH
ncbi:MULTISPECIES: siderophore-iron reductase FhuF [Symbiopectobacterium]|uniref:siderophore-iron reductase FhuF n=1 Tax=Candidatus Symbiopectobacterium endolongispinus TaxID=2812664 RepID=UPI00207AE23E|nr:MULTISPECIES: siderophore-iron reductase FhuF [Symbiopectobacterium]MBT9428110.1 siderophore-iron reductase FhuF [Candidatus Symbiopectobacterium endolongispinus]